MAKPEAAASNLKLCLFLLVLMFLETLMADTYVRPPPRKTLHFDFRSKSSSSLPQQVIPLTSMFLNIFRSWVFCIYAL